MRILENVPCGKGVAGCATDRRVPGARGFKDGRGSSGWEVLDDIWDVQGVSWIDIDDDVGPVLIRRTIYLSHYLVSIVGELADDVPSGLAGYDDTAIWRAIWEQGLIRPEQFLS